MNDKIYLDWAATSKPNTEENLKALQIAQSYYANPSARYYAGKVARDCLETARAKIAEILGANPREIFFTSGGTESNHIALCSILTKPNFQNYSVAISTLEHSALSEQARSLEKVGGEVLRIPCDELGFIKSETVLQTIKDNTCFVSLMTTNNEIGSIQPIREIAEILKKSSKRKVHFHTDGVQALGKNILNISELGVDSFSMSAHKIGGMRGVGLLYLKSPLEVFNKGGSQESGIRPGTENLAGILSLQYALEKYAKHFTENLNATKAKMDYLIKALSKMPDIVLIPKIRKEASQSADKFSPYILQLAHRKIAGEVMVRVLSDKGIYVSTGSACSSAKLSRPVLQAIKLPKTLQQNAFRVSLGNTTTIDELKTFVKELTEIGNMLG